MHAFRRRSRVVAPLLAVLALLVVSLPVSAHAVLEATFPQADATVPSPTEVAARFNEPLEPNSRIEVLGPDGATVASGGRDPANPARLLITIPDALEAGEYTVQLTAVSADGHIERPTFQFAVAAPTEPPATTPEPSPTTPVDSSTAPPPSATADPTDAPAPSPSTPPTEPADATTGDVLVPIIAALVVVGVLGAILLRGRTVRRS